MTERWSGSPVTRARAYWATRLPLPCYRCGKPVLPEQAWQVEHVIDRTLGGALGIENQWVSHARENMSAGGRRGAQITNAAKLRKNPARGGRIETRPLHW